MPHPPACPLHLATPLGGSELDPYPHITYAYACYVWTRHGANALSKYHDPASYPSFEDPAYPYDKNSAIFMLRKPLTLYLVKVPNDSKLSVESTSQILASCRRDPPWREGTANLKQKPFMEMTPQACCKEIILWKKIRVEGKAKFRKFEAIWPRCRPKLG